MNRRSVLAGVGTAVAVGTAGCLASFQSEEPQAREYHLELTVQNNHDRPYDIRAVLNDAGETAVFEQTFTLGPGEGRGFGDDFPAGEYTLTLTLPDRSSLRSYWNTDLCEVHQVRTEIGADGRAAHNVACHAEGTDPPPIGDAPPTESI
jgi:hypothetical protein